MGRCTVVCNLSDSNHLEARILSVSGLLVQLHTYPVCEFCTYIVV